VNLIEELKRLVDALRRGRLPYAVCGGIALAAHGFPRFTKDIDLLVRPSDVERILRVVRGLGYRVSAGSMTFHRGQRAETTIHRVSKFVGEEFLTLELVEVSPTLASVWRQRERHRWEGRVIQVVSAAGLARMKKAAGRKQDLADLEKLKGGTSA
jgi:hypothetical protein